MKTRKEDVDWEKEYKIAEGKLWEQKAHTYSRLATGYVKNGKVLDIGSGEGYDCFYFAQKGYDALGIDISKTVIKKMLDRAGKYSLKLKGLAKDITKSKIGGKYNIIVSYGVFQFLGSNFLEFIDDLKNKTLPGGINSFYIFGNKGDFYKLAKHRFYFPSEKTLKELYSDWKIVKFSKKNTKLLIRGDKGEVLHNLMFKLLARKIG
ncbi:MAG: methyltransferase domain-containing protein [Candidatus Yanofskybacteria bacterium]|nr:methyltransferase domain-containing protein [Candidatus Yanofskybacteria bacterium]